MNRIVNEKVAALQTVFNGQTDAGLLDMIFTGHHSGDALFYLMFGRYGAELQTLFNTNGPKQMEFSDFMLELNMKLYNDSFKVLKTFNAAKASFKIWLSKVASNLLYDLRKKERDTYEINDNLFLIEYDNERIMMLIDEINNYPKPDSRYVLRKVIEGYSSREIAGMLTSLRHEKGTLPADEQLKSSYIDTLRSRALRDIGRNMIKKEREEKRLIIESEEPLECCCIAPRRRTGAPMSAPGLENCGMADRYAEPEFIPSFTNFFFDNLQDILFESLTASE